VTPVRAASASNVSRETCSLLGTTRCELRLPYTPELGSSNRVRPRSALESSCWPGQRRHGGLCWGSRDRLFTGRFLVDRNPMGHRGQETADNKSPRGKLSLVRKTPGNPKRPFVDRGTVSTTRESLMGSRVSRETRSAKLPAFWGNPSAPPPGLPRHGIKNGGRPLGRQCFT
jgi:hypothetical protein